MMGTACVGVKKPKVGTKVDTIGGKSGGTDFGRLHCGDRNVSPKRGGLFWPGKPASCDR